MTERFLFIVSEVVEIGASRLLLVPGIADEDVSSIRPGMTIELRLPSGVVVVSCIYGVMSMSPRVVGSGFPLSLPPGIDREAVPLGTEVWLSAHTDSASGGELHC